MDRMSTGTLLQPVTIMAAANNVKTTKLEKFFLDMSGMEWSCSVLEDTRYH